MISFRLILLFLGMSLPQILFTQDVVSFDNSLHHQLIYIDSTANPDNIWQIGISQKNSFSPNDWALKSIITDTINSYPPNDTSTFYCNFSSYFNNYFSLGFIYLIDCDTINDFGIIEISGDSGETWINPFVEADEYNFGFRGDVIDGTTFTGTKLAKTSGHWRWIEIDMYGWAVDSESQDGNYPSYITSDTLIVRFSFISDEIDNNKPGWAIDNIYLSNIILNNNEIDKGNNIEIYPNPLSEELNIKTLDDEALEIELYSINGKKISTFVKEDGVKNLRINTSHIPSGIYFIRYSNNEMEGIKKLLKL